MYHSADSQPVTGEANVTLHVNELPHYARQSQSECFMLSMLFDD